MMRMLESDPSAGDHRAKAELFDALGEIAGAVAAGRRAEIIDLLAQGERSVDEIAAEIHQSIANASHHLRTLARTGLVRTRRDGTRIYYRLTGPEVEELLDALRRVAETARVDLERLTRSYLGDLDDLEVLDRDELTARLSTGEVIVLDVRPAAEYRAGHVPGARSVPLAELTDRLAELPDGVPVVVYCRGPFCVFAPAAVRVLAAQGIHAARLQDGFPEWRRAGLPVAVGDEPGHLRAAPTRHRRAAR